MEQKKIIHDINNHLTSVMLAAELMTATISQKEQKKYARQILADVKKIRNLISKINPAE